MKAGSRYVCFRPATWRLVPGMFVFRPATWRLVPGMFF